MRHNGADTQLQIGLPSGVEHVVGAVARGGVEDKAGGGCEKLSLRGQRDKVWNIRLFCVVCEVYI